MSPALSIAASLSPDTRQDIGIQVLARTEPISHLATTHQVSHKFVYQQGDKARRSLDESFVSPPADNEVLFYLPVTENWLYQLILGLVLLCYSSYRGVVKLFRDLFDTPSSVGTVHNRLEAALRGHQRSIEAKTSLALRWACWMKLFRPTNPCWLVSMPC